MAADSFIPYFKEKNPVNHRISMSWKGPTGASGPTPGSAQDSPKYSFQHGLKPPNPARGLQVDGVPCKRTAGKAVLGKAVLGKAPRRGAQPCEVLMGSRMRS